jgi:transcriptional regulator with XRE-family HTH domain
MNQTQLAKLCGLRPPSINDWESGKTKMIDGRNLILAARALQTSPEWIMTGAGVLESQPSRLDPEMIAESIEVLRRIYQRRGKTYDPVQQPEALTYAYELRSLMGEEPTQDQLIDFGAKLAERLRANEGTGDGREKDKQAAGVDRARAKGRASA